MKNFIKALSQFTILMMVGATIILFTAWAGRKFQEPVRVFVQFNAWEGSLPQQEICEQKSIKLKKLDRRNTYYWVEYICLNPKN